MFVDISKVFTERQIDITSMNVRTSKQGKATIIMTFDIQGIEELNRLTDKLRQIEGVLDIERTAKDSVAAAFDRSAEKREQRQIEDICFCSNYIRREEGETS